MLLKNKNKEKIALSAKEDIKDKQEYIRNTIDSIKRNLKMHRKKESNYT